MTTNPEDIKTLAALNEFIKECEINNIYYGATDEGRNYTAIKIEINIISETDKYKEFCSRMGTEDEMDKV